MVEWLVVGGVENGVYFDSLCGGNVVVECMGIVWFLELVVKWCGVENCRYFDLYCIYFFFFGGWLDGVC